MDPKSSLKAPSVYIGHGVPYNNDFDFYENE